MYRYLLFDADGTLFDFDTTEKTAFDATCIDLGIEPTLQRFQTYKQINRQVWDEFELGTITLDHLQVERFARFFASEGLDNDPVPASSLFTSYLAQGGHLYPETISLLEELTERGYDLHLITNGIAHVQHGRLCVSDTEKFFSTICISEEVGYQKPLKEFFQAFFKQAGIDESEHHQCLVIGDRLSSDILGANNAGLDSCWYNPQGVLGDPDIEPTYEIGLLQELLTLLPPVDQTI